MVSIPVIKLTVEPSLMKPVMLQLSLNFLRLKWGVAEFEDTGEK